MVKRALCSLPRKLFSNTAAQAADEGKRISQKEAEKLPSKNFVKCNMLLNQRINDMTKDSLEEVLRVFEMELHEFFVNDGTESKFGFKHFHHDKKYHRKDHDEKKMLRDAIKEVRVRMEIKRYGNVVFDINKVGLHKKPTILSVLPSIKLSWLTYVLNLFK